MSGGCSDDIVHNKASCKVSGVDERDKGVSSRYLNTSRRNDEISQRRLRRRWQSNRLNDRTAARSSRRAGVT